MKKFALFLLTLLLAATTFGQAGKQTFDLAAGAMFPLGDFADNNLADSSSGASSVGYHIQVGYNYQLSNNFGIGIHVEFNDAKYSMKKVREYYETLLDDATKEISSEAGWTIGGIYLRYFIRFPLGSKVSWDISPMVGGMGTYSPQYQIIRTSFPVHKTDTYIRQRSKAFSFAYGVETRFNFKVNQHGFFLESSILRSKANFKQVTGTGYDGKPYDQNIKMDLMYVSAYLGYAYYF